jgi:hypothetical protein
LKSTFKILPIFPAAVLFFDTENSEENPVLLISIGSTVSADRLFASHLVDNRLRDYGNQPQFVQEVYLFLKHQVDFEHGVRRETWVCWLGSTE